MMEDVAKYFLVPLLAALLTYWFGTQSYYRKNEHEQIIHRYLEQGIDLLAANIDHAFNTFNENFAHALGLLKEFRDTEKAGVPLRKESLEKEFILYKPESFSLIPFYKLKSLVGDDIFWDAVQHFFAFIGGTYNFYERDLKLAIQAYYTNREKIKVSSEVLVDKYIDNIRKLMDDSFQFYLILMELQNIALILETDSSLTFKKLENLKKDERIIKIVVELKEKFKDTNTSGSVKEGAIKK